jgi:hypothetical protein
MARTGSPSVLIDGWNGNDGTNAPADAPQQPAGVKE